MTNPDLQAIEAAAREWDGPQDASEMLTNATKRAMWEHGRVGYIRGGVEWSTRAERAIAERVLPVLETLGCWAVWTKGTPPAMRSGLFHLTDGDAPDENDWNEIGKALMALASFKRDLEQLVAAGEEQS